LRPYFLPTEIRQAIAGGLEAASFSDLSGGQVNLVPQPMGEGYLCPAFDPQTRHCRIYEVRPLDCRIYPFVVMWNADHTGILLGWDTKCPFLLHHSAPQEEHSPELSLDSVRMALPEETLRMAHHVAASLESEQIIVLLTDHPQFVTRFQEDVVSIQPLPILTEHLM